VATSQNDTPYSADAPCCGASARTRAFSVFQEEPADAACRCCGTMLVEGTVVPGQNFSADDARFELRRIAPDVPWQDAYLEPWLRRTRLYIHLMDDEELAAMSAPYVDATSDVAGEGDQ
jgi:hypothetical protein